MGFLYRKSTRGVLEAVHAYSVVVEEILLGKRLFVGWQAFDRMADGLQAGPERVSDAFAHMTIRLVFIRIHPMVRVARDDARQMQDDREVKFQRDRKDLRTEVLVNLRGRRDCPRTPWPRGGRSHDRSWRSEAFECACSGRIGHAGCGTPRASARVRSRACDRGCVRRSPGRARPRYCESERRLERVEAMRVASTAKDALFR